MFLREAVLFLLAKVVFYKQKKHLQKHFKMKVFRKNNCFIFLIRKNI